MHYKLFDKPESSLPSSEKKPYFFSVAKTKASLDALIREDLFRAPITGTIECSRPFGTDGSAMREMLSNKDFNGESAILLGHAGDNDYGGFSPTEFANMLMQAPKGRLNGMTFYMMGCHMDVFCEKVASILNNKGYKNVTFVAFDEYSCQMEGQNVHWYPTSLQRSDGKLQFYGAPMVRTNIKNQEEINQLAHELNLNKQTLAATEASLKEVKKTIQELTDKLKLPQPEGEGATKEMEIKLQQFQEEEKRLNGKYAMLQSTIQSQGLTLEVMRYEFNHQFLLGQVNGNAKDVMGFLSQYGKTIRTPIGPGAEITITDPSVLLQAKAANAKGARVLGEIQADISKGSDVSDNYVPPRLG